MTSLKRLQEDYDVHVAVSLGPTGSDHSEQPFTGMVEFAVLLRNNKHFRKQVERLNSGALSDPGCTCVSVCVCVCVRLFRHSNRGLITKGTIGSPVGKRPPFAKRVQNI